MSRIIVKNLPSGITEKKFRETFSAKGFVTDAQLKYTKSGVFRKFGFIGYKTIEEAQAAKDYFNSTYINTSQIQVEICTNLSDPNKPKPWKFFVEEKAKVEQLRNEKKEKGKSEKPKSNDGIPEELKTDSRFKEFLAVHQDRKSKPIWTDDTDDFHDTLVDSKSSEEQTSSDGKNSESPHKFKEDSKKETSIVLKKETDSLLRKEGSLKQAGKRKIHEDLNTVKLKNLPYNCKKKKIKEFFHPLKIESLRFPPKNKGFAYVKFKTEKDMKQALIKHKGFLGGHRIDVAKYTKKEIKINPNENNDKQDEEDKEKDLELLAETGRIFVRNLCYSVTETEVEELFSKYGPLAEVQLPIDLLTKQCQGFAFVSYVFAEHAVKAFSVLDGTIFQGRMLHLIPAKPKKEYKIDENESNYKKKKGAKMKALSGSSHNWNILFLGANAVADVIAEKYNVEKSKLLSGGTNESVAVRMALAETKAVAETRKFLIDSGVELDAFSQPAAERSRTVIIVKDLPAKTTSEDLNEIFSKYGTISRIVLPPSGIVAIVEFQEPAEAKAAFAKLAYTRFRYVPLYLEWAPVNALKAPSVENSRTQQHEQTENTSTDDTKYKEESKTSKDTKESVNVKSDDENDDEPPPGTTIFVKNLNFNTIQEDFQKHFRQCGPIHYAVISSKKDIKSGKLLSMGFGFVQFKTKEAAVKAIQNLQLSQLDGHSLELKFATRATKPVAFAQRKKAEVKKQLSAKILIRNIPFEASEKEIRDLFKEFGSIKFVRLPKKIGCQNEHRGFGFVEYTSKSDAKRAFEALCHSTHLFGRRLVLEWANPESEDVDELRKKTAKDFVEHGPKAKLKKSRLKEDVALASLRSTAEEE